MQYIVSSVSKEKAGFWQRGTHMNIYDKLIQMLQSGSYDPEKYSALKKE